MKVQTKNLKTDALNAASTMGGFMVANVATKVIPLQNSMIKSAIPLALGLGATLVTDNATVKSAAYGAMAHGALSLVKATLMGNNPIGARTSSNPMVAKVLNYVVPEGLGSVEADYSIAFDPYEDVTEAYEEPMMLNGLEELSSDSFMDGEINADAFGIGFVNDDYSQAIY